MLLPRTTKFKQVVTCWALLDPDRGVVLSCS